VHLALPRSPRTWGVDPMSIEHTRQRAQRSAVLTARALAQPRRWRLWTVPRPLIGYLLAVEALAVAVTVIGSAPAAVDRDDLRVFALVVGLGVAAAELTRHVERLRRRFADTPHVNMSSVWTLTAALLLPPALAATTVVVLYLHLWLRSWYRVRGVHFYRLIFSTSTVILACHGAHTTAHHLAPTALTTLHHNRSVLALAAAVLAYSAINSGLVAAAIALHEGHLAARRVLGSLHDNAVEYATLGLGLCTTALLLIQPLLILALLPVVTVLHRCVLTRQVDHAATTDHTTGLLNATTWTTLATTELTQATPGTTTGLLIVDLDHFTRIIDTHGHPTGDRILHQLATTLRETARPTDLLGRLAHEEFVILCPHITPPELTTLGHRICTRARHLRPPITTTDDPTLADLTITVSIGAATHPDAGPTLDDLLRAADVALFAAKDNGRNQIQTTTNTITPDH